MKEGWCCWRLVGWSRGTLVWITSMMSSWGFHRQPETLVRVISDTTSLCNWTKSPITQFSSVLGFNQASPSGSRFMAFMLAPRDHPCQLNRSSSIRRLKCMVLVKQVPSRLKQPCLSWWLNDQVSHMNLTILRFHTPVYLKKASLQRQSTLTCWMLKIRLFGVKEATFRALSIQQCVSWSSLLSAALVVVATGAPEAKLERSCLSSLGQNWFEFKPAQDNLTFLWMVKLLPLQPHPFSPM